MNEKSVNGITIRLLKPNWMLTTYEDNSLINATILEELRIAYTELHGSEDLSELRLIQIFDGRIEFAHDVGERYLTNRIRPKVGEAFVSKDAKTIEFLNGAKALMSQTHPVEVFSTMEEAEAWLESLS